jgi:predicted TIM-barrel fold metal-dependent hydrolase
MCNVFDLGSKIVDPIFDVCQANEKPVVIHIGKEPKSPSYSCDPYDICSVDKLERVLIDIPELKICVPHLGYSDDKTRDVIDISGNKIEPTKESDNEIRLR